MLISHPPKFLQRVYSSLIWNIPNNDKGVYLTFDDGPTPKVTELVLDLLQEYNAKATFFCLGKNVKKHNDIYNRILREGHRVGNHSQNHLNGWKSNNSFYVKDALLSSQYIKSNLYRPPYGKINTQQIRRLKKRFQIIMWSILTRDYDQKISKEKCLSIAATNLKSGSILVFHDSIKAERNMIFALKGVLEYCQENKLNCLAIPEKINQ